MTLLPAAAGAVAVILAALVAAPLAGAAAGDAGALTDLSIEDLGRIDITSVTKTPEPLSDAPAAIYVITHDEIIQSGARTIPEMLRLAPNLEVAQINANSYAITARGFNGGANASFSDKLLILIDGRVVYSPLFSGVYWDSQDIPPEDIERIEVISGPGSTLWGANAVNGVINIITRNSRDTGGGELVIGGGNLGGRAMLQYGGRLAPDLTYRAYLSDFYTAASRTSAGTNAADDWTKPQGGFRLDWSPGADSVTFEGDVYDGTEDEVTGPDGTVAGGNVVAHWSHRFDDGSALQLETYYDNVRRFVPDGGGFVLNSYDFDLQHSFALGARNDIVWGFGDRFMRYAISDLLSLRYVPGARSLNLASAFIQDSITLTPNFKLILGTKIEDDPFSGVSPMPSARLSWKPADRLLLWSAVSRAIRAPSPFDVDIEEKIGSLVFLRGNPDFQPEKLTAYEVGARMQPTPHSTLSLSAFYNVYDDLRSIELNPDGLILPLVWGNRMAGETHGVEAWGSYRPFDWWRLAAGVSLLARDLRFKPGSSRLGGIAIAGDDPSREAFLRSTVTLGDSVTWEASLRYVGALPDPAIPDYAELDSRLAWAATPKLELSLAGFNLLHPHHVEFTAAPPMATLVGRSFYLEARLRF